ncbi:ABC transporter substrate-binding protein [Bacillus sp. FJAT-49736]|uniref:ABC transporter substrate-binding protein n=1 Tax=Bacillus sp. FJAT-49736 TaxID=2833582 RepID=UPI001BCA60EF|nr:ABC transporter substrate-binding protein [Bacillus sp. FJAT-49736]MBS4171786.1 ABC transporter substrate-binding protein [Bacillus sp. FJAT-49736]
MKKWKKTAVVLLSAVLLTACGSKTSTPSSSEGKTNKGETKEKTYSIGVTQIVEHPSLDAAFEGFKKALEDGGIKAEYNIQNAQGDPSASTTIATNLVNSKVDLIFANSTPSAQAAASQTKDIPIVFTSVTDPIGAKLVSSMENPGGNITGTIDTHPEAIPNTLKFMKEKLNIKKVGMVYNSGEQNSRAQVNTVKKIASEIGLEIKEASVATSADVKQATESLVGKVDGLYIISDNTVVSALESVISVANKNKLPMMAAEFDSVRKGALGAYGFEYYDIGYEAGQMAVKILKGESKPSDIPVQVPQNLKLVINKKTASTIGVEIKDDWNAETTE